ncbi:uncharacterized protein O3C94_020544 isoform 2-T2 [Discoglossus pictus]
MINKKMTERILTQALEIISLLTGEVSLLQHLTNTVMRTGEVGAAGDVIMRPGEVSLLQHLANMLKIIEMKDKKMILSYAKEITHLLTGEVHIKCDDVAIYFSMEEWDYIEGHKELYKDVMMENHQTLRTMGIPVIRSSASNSLMINKTMTERILTHSLEIIRLLTGEVPIKCDDVAVYFSMEEWEYIEGHKEHYKDALMESHQALRTMGIPVIRSSDGSKIWNTLEEDHISSSSQVCVLDNFNVSHSDLKAKTITSTGQKTFACPECGKCFSRAINVKHHMITHTGEKPFACSECGKCFNRATNLKHHMITHTGEKTFACSECGKSFGQDKYLKRHMRTHTGEKPFACSECGKCFSQDANLYHHMRTHRGEKTFVCSECGKCFSWASELNYHMRTHTGEKPFTCSECGKCFGQDTYLKRHMRTHTGEKPFACSECGKDFSRITDLNYHMRTHTGEKMSACSECGKCFSRKADLNYHMRTHTGEKPFACSECGKCFSRASNLRVHMTNYRGIKHFHVLNVGNVSALP